MAMTQSQVTRVCQGIQAAANGVLMALDQYRAARKEYDNLDFYGGATEQQVTDSGCGVSKAAITSAVSSLGQLETHVVTNNIDDALYAARN